MTINRRTFMKSSGAIVAGVTALGWARHALAETGHLRIAMTAADLPTTGGIPNNGAEGQRFLGCPVFESLTDWDLLGAPEHRALIRPSLATEWSVDSAGTTWTFKLRENVLFHDGAKLDANLIAWNFDRVYNSEAPHFDQIPSVQVKAFLPMISGYRAIDDMTVEVTTDRPASYLPELLPRMLFVSKARYDEVGSWNAFAAQPAGSGPFMISNVSPRVSVEMTPYTAYWNPDRVPKLQKMTVYPMPEPTTRLAALRSGQVDWIEVPPPDTIPSLKQAGFEVVTRPYPHCWPWVFSFSEGSPFRDKRVRQALNFAINREGLVDLLNQTAQPATGFVTKDDAWYGNPAIEYGFDPNRAKALLQEAGYSEENPLRFKVMISSGGSGQMVPLPMNEYLQQNLREVGVQVEYEIVEWGTMLVALRKGASDAVALGCQAMNISLPYPEPSAFGRVFHENAIAPNGLNWGGWRSPEIDALVDQIGATFEPEAVNGLMRRVHEIVVDEAPWLFVVHDLNPRAISSKVKNYHQAQSWYQDFTGIVVE
ncbi:ABC transporter substrate-binding protein [Mesorhizobium sp. M7A.F.Ca.US.006.01.1.1]|uniref:ABC transporter substrate-binding protein n=1 Tax=Mesorhizobium sp. M7A.F.Ca.US.006.01.1.1 TaxID=2496707 RepID=UPI000FCC2D15|nr:ABC transporter substrate-binding protein [Mesorhizobium sp. M7A.F.Ca.US.006.01.1.1]RUZ71181.1 ABC transporter substrate-binding protein [Mesorhizobium sp. M7A.F.Ca.US.006.01.1.1]